MVIYEEKETNDFFVEDILPLAIHVENQVEYCNKKKISLDEGDLSTTIEEVRRASNLSLREIN